MSKRSRELSRYCSARLPVKTVSWVYRDYFFTATARIGRRVICRGHYGEFVDYVKTREVVVADRIWVRNIHGLRILFNVN